MRDEAVRRWMSNDDVTGKVLDTGVLDADSLVLNDVARIALRRSFEEGAAELVP